MEICGEASDPEDKQMKASLNSADTVYRDRERITEDNTK